VVVVRPRNLYRVNWRKLLIAGVTLAVAAALTGLVIDRNEVGVVEPQGVYYVHQWPTPFEREVYLEPDHRALLSEGDSGLWYFASGAILLLTLAAVPALVERERRGGGAED
jgi:type IV secretory pathway protease TraF